MFTPISLSAGTKPHNFVTYFVSCYIFLADQGYYIIISQWFLCVVSNTARNILENYSPIIEHVMRWLKSLIIYKNNSNEFSGTLFIINPYVCFK